ncbi:MAG: nuclear transport factor 2 family protein [Candidatus Competibacteraceae bacterium]|nr:nuclear transport factor 2 family protein [Candidatus Competibacteraceae bacterium]
MRRLVLFIMYLWLVLPITGLAQDADPKALAEIQTTFQQHDAAMNGHDLDGVMALYSTKPNTVMLGTGPGERWVGKEEIAAAYAEFFKDYDPNTFNSECTWRSGGINGNAAWLVAMCQVTDYLKNVKREYALNISAVLEKQDGKWQFSMLHFSNLTGGE